MNDLQNYQKIWLVNCFPWNAAVGPWIGICSNIDVSHRANIPPCMVCNLLLRSSLRNPPDGRWYQNHTAWHLRFSVSRYWKVSRLDGSLLVPTPGSEGHGLPETTNKQHTYSWLIVYFRHDHWIYSASLTKFWCHSNHCHTMINVQLRAGDLSLCFLWLDWVI